MYSGVSVIQATITPAADGWRLDRALAEAVPTLSRERLKVLIAGGKVTRDGLLVREPARKAAAGEGEGRQLLYSGIATRAFERRFQLADFVRVDKADLADGLLVIDLVREVPEAMKPHKIAIGGTQPTLFDGDKKAA